MWTRVGGAIAVLAVVAGLTLITGDPAIGEETGGTVPVTMLNLSVALTTGDALSPQAIDVCLDDETDPRWDDLDPGEVTSAVHLSKEQHWFRIYPAADGVDCAGLAQASNALVHDLNDFTGEELDLAVAEGPLAMLFVPFRPQRTEEDFECDDNIAVVPDAPGGAGQADEDEEPAPPGPAVSSEASCLFPTRFVLVPWELRPCPSKPAFVNVTDLRSDLAFAWDFTYDDGSSGQLAGTMKPTQLPFDPEDWDIDGTEITQFAKEGKVGVGHSVSFPDEIPSIGAVTQPSFTTDPASESSLTFYFGGPVASLTPLPADPVIEIRSVRLAESCPAAPPPTEPTTPHATTPSSTPSPTVAESTATATSTSSAAPIAFTG